MDFDCRGTIEDQMNKLKICSEFAPLGKQHVCTLLYMLLGVCLLFDHVKRGTLRRGCLGIGVVFGVHGRQHVLASTHVGRCR